MTEQGLENQLLSEIRDLLTVVAGALRPQFRETVLRELGPRADELRRLVRSDRRWEALILMDGTRTRAVIARQTKVDQGDLTKLVQALVAARFVRLEGNNPRAILPREWIEAVRHG